MIQSNVPTSTEHLILTGVFDFRPGTSVIG
jgi:hypothetical protein